MCADLPGPVLPQTANFCSKDTDRANSASLQLLPCQGHPVRGVRFRVLERLGETVLLLIRRAAASSGGMWANPERGS